MAENCNNYCTDPIEDQTLNDCSEELLGGISSLLTLECDHQLIDPSNATQIQAEIDAGRAHLILNIKAGLPAASPITVESQATNSGTPTLVNYDRTLTLIDGNVNDNNVNMYNKMFNSYKFGGLILYLFGTEESIGGAKVQWINKAVKGTGSLIIPDNVNEFMRFEGTLAWKGKNNGNIYDAPVGIFS